MDDLASLRAKLSWSQEDMATYLGCSQPTVFRIEGGQRASGSIARMISRLTVLVADGDALPGMTPSVVVVLAIGKPKPQPILQSA